MSRAVIFVLLLGVLSSWSKKVDTMNFVVFDDGRSPFEYLWINRTLKHCLGNNVKIRNIHRIHINYSRTIDPREIEKEWQAVVNGSSEKVDFVFDFTEGEVSKDVMSSAIGTTDIPFISTNSAFKQVFLEPRPTYGNFIANLRQNQVPDNYIQFNTVQTQLERVADAILVNALASPATLISGNLVIKNVRLDKWETTERMKIEYKWDSFSASAPNVTTLMQWIKEDNPSMIFLYGTEAEIKQVLEEAEKHKDELLGENRTWWIFPTEIGYKFKLPKEIKRVVVASPQLHLNYSLVKSAGSKNIIELFYMDIISQTVLSVGELKANGSNSIAKAQLRTAMLNKFKMEQALGKYVDDARHQGLTPSISPFKFVLHEQNGTTPCVVTVQVQNMVFVRKDPTVWQRLLPIDILTATIVVDPPYVIRDEKCFVKKEKKDESLLCYDGIAIQILQKICKVFPAMKILVKSEESYGGFTKSGWTGARNTITSKGTEGRALGIGAFSTLTNFNKLPLRLTAPFAKDQYSEDEFGFAFNWNQKIHQMKFNFMITKLTNQRYTEQVAEKWYYGSDYKANRNSTH